MLRSLTIGELLDEASAPVHDGLPIDPRRLARARRASGIDFDAHLHEVLAEAEGQRVCAAYLRARVGGPRWKLQSALRRLIAAGLVQRSGTTSATRYRVAPKGRA